MSGSKPPQGDETDGLSLLSYLNGGQTATRHVLYWELNESGRPIQAARFGEWKAVRNGTDIIIEIYDLAKDAVESKDLSASRPDPHSPLDRPSETMVRSREEAGKVTRQRGERKWLRKTPGLFPITDTFRKTLNAWHFF